MFYIYLTEGMAKSVLTKSEPSRRCIPIKGSSPKLSLMNLSALPSTLSDHCKYFCRYMLPSLTGKGAGAPANAITGQVSPGYLKWKYDSYRLIESTTLSPARCPQGIWSGNMTVIEFAVHFVWPVSVWDKDLVFSDFLHVMENLPAWKRVFQACKFSITCPKSENTTSLSPF